MSGVANTTLGLLPEIAIENSTSSNAKTVWHLTKLLNVTAVDIKGPEIPSEITLLVSAVYLTSVGIIATVGNFLVLFVILSDKKLREKPHNHLLISLAISDLLRLFGGYPFTIISGYCGDWLFGDWACQFSGFFVFFLAVTSMNLLVAICCFRYVMICLPGKSFFLTRRFTMYVILFAFAYGLFWTALPLLGWGAYGREPFLISCSLDWTNQSFSSISYFIATFFFCYVGHVTIMTKCYRHISKTVADLAQRDRNRGRIVLEDEMVYRSKVADDAQVTRMCFFIVVVYATIWTPYAIFSAVYIFYHDMPLYMTTLPTLFAKASCMINPIVYFLTSRTFRTRAKAVFGCDKESNDIPANQQNNRPQENSEVVRKYDKVSKDGIYLGQEAKTMEVSATMF